MNAEAVADATRWVADDLLRATRERQTTCGKSAAGRRPVDALARLARLLGLPELTKLLSSYASDPAPRQRQDAPRQRRQRSTR